MQTMFPLDCGRTQLHITFTLVFLSKRPVLSSSLKNPVALEGGREAHCHLAAICKHCSSSLTNSEMCCHTFISTQSQKRGWLWLVPSLLRWGAEGNMLSPRMQKDLFWCSLLRQHKGEGGRCVQNTLFSLYFSSCCASQLMPLCATNCCTLHGGLHFTADMLREEKGERERERPLLIPL